MGNRFFSFLSGDYGDDAAMDETQYFRIKYDGEALADHTIDINDLAPALLSLADLLQEANRIANHDAAKISIKVKATEAGCFDIKILAVQTIQEELVKVFAGDKANAITNLTSLLWWGKATVGAAAASNGLLWLIRYLRGKKTVKAIAKGDEVEIQTESGSVTVSKLEWEMFQSPVIRKSIYGVLKPLERPGIEKVEFIDDKEQVAEVKKSEVQFYVPPEQAIEPLSDTQIRETWVNVVHSWLQGGNNKWKFKEGENQWTAEIKDNKFLEQLLKGEISINGSTLLKVRVKQAQYREGNTVHSDYEILEVMENAKGYRQIQLH